VYDTQADAPLEVFTARAREAGPCMFCPRQMGTGGTSPQAQVVVVRGGPAGAQVNFCPECFGIVRAFREPVQVPKG
jgi:hypothetical protein